MASASSAPIIPAAFFSAKGSLFGLAAPGEVLMGAPSGGGLVSTAAPVLAGATINDTSGGAAAGLTVTNGGIGVTAGGIRVAADGIEVTAGGAQVAGGITMLDGTLSVPSGSSAAFGDTGLVIGTDGAGLPILSTNADRIDLLFTGAAAGSLRLTNSTATEAGDVATKGYVDSVASGLDVKASVAAKTVAALSAVYAEGVWTALATEALPAIDTVELVEGSRVLVDQVGSASQAGAGIFVVSGVGGVGAKWTLARAGDADTTAKVTPGMFVFVTGGATAGDRGYVLTNDAVTNLNTDVLSFTQFTSVAAPVPGADTQLIYNDGGVLAGSSKAIFNKTSGSITLSTGSLMLSEGMVSAAELAAPGATIGLKAIPQAESGAVAGASASTASLATAMCVLSTLPFDGTTTVTGASEGRARKITVPAGSMFIPMGAIAWCSALTIGGASHLGAVELTAASAGVEVAKITLNQPNYEGTGAGVGHSRLQWSSSSNRGIGAASAVDISVDVSVTGAPSDAFELRFGLIGFLVKAEA